MKTLGYLLISLASLVATARANFGGSTGSARADVIQVRDYCVMQGDYYHELAQSTEDENTSLELEGQSQGYYDTSGRLTFFLSLSFSGSQFLLQLDTVRNQLITDESNVVIFMDLSPYINEGKAESLTDGIGLVTEVLNRYL